MVSEGSHAATPFSCTHCHGGCCCGWDTDSTHTDTNQSQRQAGHANSSGRACQPPPPPTTPPAPCADPQCLIQWCLTPVPAAAPGPTAAAHKTSPHGVAQGPTATVTGLQRVAQGVPGPRLCIVLARVIRTDLCRRAETHFVKTLVYEQNT